ncbi:MAG: holo-ACP synthase [Peptococcaceae bacterium]|nr:holo-ACP synthase [Peptococcaceae bacterium]
MIVSIGTDIVSVARVERVMSRCGERFLQRVFTSAEREYCLGKRASSACLAARFAAKEAVLKALGIGLAGCQWRDIEITTGLRGKPGVVLSGGAAGLAAARGISEVLISLSHESDYALAFAVAVKGDTE